MAWPHSGRSWVHQAPALASAVPPYLYDRSETRASHSRSSTGHQRKLRKTRGWNMDPALPPGGGQLLKRGPRRAPEQDCPRDHSTDEGVESVVVSAAQSYRRAGTQWSTSSKTNDSHAVAFSLPLYWELASPHARNAAAGYTSTTCPVTPERSTGTPAASSRCCRRAPRIAATPIRSLATLRGRAPVAITARSVTRYLRCTRSAGGGTDTDGQPVPSRCATRASTNWSAGPARPSGGWPASWCRSSGAGRVEAGDRQQRVPLGLQAGAGLGKSPPHGPRETLGNR